jgi:Domain of unknown function (DUF4405)
MMAREMKIFQEQKMGKNEQKSNWILDVILFMGLLVSFWLDLTGVGWHQWLGVGLGVLIGWHFLAHWNWVEAVGKRLFKGTTRIATTGSSARKSGVGRGRLLFAIDLALLTGFYLIILTGLMISTWLELELSNYTTWREVHVWVSIATLALVVAKIGLHQGWIITTGRRYFSRTPGTRPALRQPGLDQTELVRAPARPASNTAKNGRRDFLMLMGVVGAAAVVSTLGALRDPAEASGEASGLTSLGAGEVQGGSLQSAYSASSACTVRCNRGCSYPGGCHRYQDANGNGRCDWGECA